MFSLISCITLREAIPLDWFLDSAFSLLSSWLWACSSACLSWCCLLRPISLVNSWFWRVNSAMAVAMDCMCWMEGGCVTGANWRSRLGLLEASLLSWWLALVALDLVLTIQSFVQERWICQRQISPSHRRRQLMLHRISRLNVPGFNETMTCLEDLKGRTRSKGDRGGPAKYSPMTKLVFLWKIRVLAFEE